MVSQVYLLPLLRQVSLAVLPLAASMPLSPGALGVQAFAEEGGRVAFKGGFLEDTVLESSLEAGEVQRCKE